MKRQLLISILLSTWLLGCGDDQKETVMNNHYTDGSNQILTLSSDNHFTYRDKSGTFEMDDHSTIIFVYSDHQEVYGVELSDTQICLNSLNFSKCFTKTK